MSKHYSDAATLADHIAGYSFNNPLAVTLTMKLRANGKNLDHIAASTNCRHFLNRLNAKVLGSAAKRFGKRLSVFAVIEQNAEGRLHYHMILDRPAHIAAEHLSALIREEWTKTDFGYRQVDVQNMYSDGWISYILKSRQKNDCLLDHIDWFNCYR